MHLENLEQITLAVPAGTERAIEEVARRRELDPDAYVRGVLLKALHAHTGYTAISKARAMLGAPPASAAEAH